jgi:hypothetical protein
VDKATHLQAGHEVFLPKLFSLCLLDWTERAQNGLFRVGDGGWVDFFPQEKRITDIGNGKIGIKVDIVFMPLLKNVVKIIQFRL